MFEFRWALPGTSKSREVTLRIHARNGWIGRKTLLIDGAPVYRRRWLGGINHKFAHPEKSGAIVELRAERDSGTGVWFPQLTCDGEVLSEVSGTSPPQVPDRPKSIAIVTGVAYLTMLMMVVMWGHIWKMLESNLGHSDNRAFVLAIESLAPRDGVRLDHNPVPPAVVGRPYDATIAAHSGTPPYEWTRTEGRMPDGLLFDEATGRIHGTPSEAGDVIIRLNVKDASGESAEWSYAITVRPENEPDLRISTESLPSGRETKEYSATIAVEGGKPPYSWVFNDRKLPKGLKKAKNDSEEASTERIMLQGIPEPNMSGRVVEVDAAARKVSINGKPISVSNDTVLFAMGKIVGLDDVSVGELLAIGGQESGAYPVRFRVYDSAYSPYNDMSPWFIPFGATAICLIGFWNMRRWGVDLYAVLILVQIAIPFVLPGFPLPTSMVAIVIQAAICAVGVLSFGRMR